MTRSLMLPALKTVAVLLAASAALVPPAHAAEAEPNLTASVGTSAAVDGRGITVLTPADATKAEIRKLRKKAIREAKREERQRDRTVLRVAASKAGAPYRYGGVGPSVFDCSGFTRWVYRHVGEDLPHSSAGQVGRTTRVSDPDPGDLVFFYGSGGVYHVGIYAGDHQVWHAPYPGRGVSKDEIWTSAVFYGRVN